LVERSLRQWSTGKALKGEQVLLGSSEHRRTFGSGRSSRAFAAPTSSRACSPESALKIGRTSADSSRRHWATR